MGLNFTFLKSNWMSHTDDVINQSFKDAYQIHKKSWILKTDWYFWFWTLSMAIRVQYPARYFLRFPRTLKEGQEIHNGLKFLKIVNLKIPWLKIFTFLFYLLLINLSIPIFLRFFNFRVTWLNYSVRKKSSYSFCNHR